MSTLNSVRARHAVIFSSRVCAIALLGTFLITPRASPAQTPAPTSGAAEAARAFRDGMTAFGAGDYLHAARRFEEAFAQSPHPDAEYNAAIAWARAGALDRAANDYAAYLRDAPNDAADRRTAEAALQDLRGALGHFDLQLRDVTEPTIDHQVVVGSSAFVLPGTHAIAGRTKDGHEVSVSRSVAAGVSMVVVLEPAAEVSQPLPNRGPQTAPIASAPPPSPRHGWSPVVFYASAGLAAVASGFTIWSGLDTVHRRSEFNASPTSAGLNDGQAAESRTNVLFYVSAGLAVLSAATAIWLVDWRGSARAAVQVGIAGSRVTAQGVFP